MIKSEFLNFFKKTSILSLVILIIYYLSVLIFKKTASPTFAVLVLFFYSVNLVVYYILLSATGKNFSKFMTNFMASTFVKLIVYVAALLIYVYFFPKNALPFIIEYFVLYIIYSIFEVLSLLNFSKKN